MGRRMESEPRFALAIHESGTTIGAGKRRRDLCLWEAVWDIPAEYQPLTKERQIIGSSRSSKQDAIANAEALIDAFLSAHALP